MAAEPATIATALADKQVEAGGLAFHTYKPNCAVDYLLSLTPAFGRAGALSGYRQCYRLRRMNGSCVVEWHWRVCLLHQ